MSNTTMNNLFMELYEEKFGKKITRPIAEEIVKNLAVTDNSDRVDGEKWTFEQTKEVGEKLGINWEKISKSEWYLVLNNTYSDHYKTVKKNGLPESIFFDLALDWFNDVDGNECKTFEYFIHI